MRKKIFVFGGIFAIIIIVFIVRMLQVSLQKKQNPSYITIVSPTPVLVPSFAATTTPPPLPVFYKKDQTEQMLHTIENRPQLSSSDTDAKTALITSLPANTETLYANNEFSVDYIESVDLFQVEILTNDITKAKADAVTWFLSQNMTKQGVCGLPVTFYLSYPVLQQAKQNGIQFSPLADGC